MSLIWSSSLLLLLLPQTEGTHLLLTSSASAVCVAVVMHLHDVEVSWCRMQAALSLRQVPSGWRLRCELLRPRPRSGRSDAGRLRLDERTPRAVRAFLQHSTLEFGK